MEQILFVDDEQSILDGLKRTFRRKRDDWDMRFALSAAQALKLLEEKPATVVVSDMKMPGRDGADLLAEVKELYPDTVRVILSGHSEIELVMKAVGPSHQYLSKPCEADVLENTIERAHALRELLQSPNLAMLVAQIDALPSMPSAYRDIVECLQRPDAGLDDVGRIISKDIGMTAKTLKLVNSAYFGLSQPVTNIEKAVIMLGLETIMSLVLTHELFSKYEQADLGSFNADVLFAYTSDVGAATRAIAKHEKLDKNTVNDAFTAAMLHDAGKLVLATEVTEAYDEVLARIGGQCEFSETIEREWLGATHPEVGAYLIGLWGLPDSIVNAVAYHETPSQCPVTEFGAMGLVHVASCIVLNPDVADPESVPALDLTYLAELGFADRWGEWQAVWHEVWEQKS